MVCCSFDFLFSSLALPLTCWNAFFIIFFPFLKKKTKQTNFHLKNLIFLIFRITKALPSPKRLSFPRWAHGCLRGQLVFPGAAVPGSRRQRCPRVTRSRTPCELLLQVMPPLEAGMEPKLEAVAFLNRKCVFDLSLSLPSYIRFFGGNFPLLFFLFPQGYQMYWAQDLQRDSQNAWDPSFLFPADCVLNLSFRIGSDHNTAKYYWASWE